MNYDILKRNQLKNDFERNQHKIHQYPKYKQHQKPV